MNFNTDVQYRKETYRENHLNHLKVI